MSVPVYNAEILNQPEKDFFDAARETASTSTPESLKKYLEMMRTDHPELLKHQGAWIDTIRRSFKHIGQGVVTIAEHGFNYGSLTTYGILCSVADKNGVFIDDIRFDAKNFADSDPHEPRDPRKMSTLQLSGRGEMLPERFPTIYKSGVIVVSSFFEETQKEMEALITRRGIEVSLQTVSIVNYLAGIAEVVSPLERFAEVAALEEQIGLKGNESI